MFRICFLFFALTVVGLWVQASIVHTSYPSAVAPDIVLVLVVTLAMRHASVYALAGGFVLGLAADFASAQFIGPNAAGSVVAFCVAVLIASKVYADKAVAVCIVAFVCSLAKSAVVLSMLAIHASHLVETSELIRIEVLKVVLLEAVLNALLAPIVARLIYPAKSAAMIGVRSRESLS